MASCRALIVDVAPVHLQESANAWAGIMIGLGNVLGYFTGYIDLVSLFPALGSTQLQVLCIFAIGFFLLCISISCMFTREVANSDIVSRHWLEPFFTVVKNMRNLPSSVQNICNIQLVAWIGWFPFLFYVSSWVAEIAKSGHPTEDPLYSVRSGSFALLLFAIVSLLAGILLPAVQKMAAVSLPKIWALSLWLLGSLLISTVFVNSLYAAYAVTSLVGISWAATLWVPFALLGEIINGRDAHKHVQHEYQSVGLEDPYDDSGPQSTGQLEAGVILGIHNVYIVMPQFISTIISSTVFAVLSWLFPDTNQLSSFVTVLFLCGTAPLFAGILAYRMQVDDLKEQ